MVEKCLQVSLQSLLHDGEWVADVHSDEEGCKCGCWLGRIFGMRRLRRLCRLLRGSLHPRRMSRRHMPWLQNLYITYSLISLFSFWLIHFPIPCFAMIHSVLFALFVVACYCLPFLLRFEHMPSHILHTPNLPPVSFSISVFLSHSLSVFLSLCLFTCLPLGQPFLFNPNWLFLQPCTISPLFALESPPCCIQVVELSEALLNPCAYHLLSFFHTTPFACFHWRFGIPYLTNRV